MVVVTRAQANLRLNNSVIQNSTMSRDTKCTSDHRRCAIYWTREPLLKDQEPPRTYGGPYDGLRSTECLVSVATALEVQLIQLQASTQLLMEQQQQYLVQHLEQHSQPRS